MSGPFEVFESTGGWPFPQEMAGWARGGTKPEYPEKTAESKPPNRYHMATLEMKMQTAPC